MHHPVPASQGVSFSTAPTGWGSSILTNLQDADRVGVIVTKFSANPENQPHPRRW